MSTVPTAEREIAPGSDGFHRQCAFDPGGHVVDQRDIGHGRLLVLGEAAFALFGDPRWLSFSYSFEADLVVGVERAAPASPVGIHHLDVARALQHQHRGATATSIGDRSTASMLRLNRLVSRVRVAMSVAGSRSAVPAR